jgi:hypothetical protein
MKVGRPGKALVSSKDSLFGVLRGANHAANTRDVETKKSKSQRHDRDDRWDIGDGS